MKLVPIPKTHFKNLRIQISFYCWEKQVCPTDLRQEVGNTRLTRAIIFAKLLLVVCKKEKPTGNTFRGEGKCITKKKTQKILLSAVKQLLLSHRPQHTEVMRPGRDPTIKSERNKQQDSWCKQLGWIQRMYMQIFGVNVHAPFRSWVIHNTHMLRISSMTLSVS